MNKYKNEISRLTTMTTYSLKVTQINECKNMSYNMSLKGKVTKICKKNHLN
jgi:hypothetical protein